MIATKTDPYDSILSRLISWAIASDDIKLLLLIGSRAREDRPADEYSDLDVVLVATDPGALLQSDRWIKGLGEYWLSFCEDTLCGGKERRVLFDGALDADFLLFAEKDIAQVLGDGESQALVSRGWRVLVDKAGLAGTLPPPCPRPVGALPAQKDFGNLVGDFWFHAVWSAKKLRRGELWTAKSCVDSYMKGRLLRMIELHARATHGWELDTWHAGRFLDRWAEPAVRKRLRCVFAHYDEKDVGRALLATMDLFRSLAVEVAERLALDYPSYADEKATDWVQAALTKQ